MNSITLDQTDPKLGDTVTFTTEVEDSRKVTAPSIRLDAFRDDGALIWATAGLVGRDFVLGGTASQWKTEGGPAHVVATLYYWSHNRKFVALAHTEFDVAG